MIHDLTDVIPVMKNKSSKKLILILLLGLFVLAAVLIFSLLKHDGGSYLKQSEDRLIIVNLDVGKADSAVFFYKGSVGMIDTGTEEAWDNIDSFLKDHGVKSIDCLILSHFDKDHIGSAVNILKNYEVGEVYYPDYVSEKKLYPALMEELAEEDKGSAVNTEMTVNLSDLPIDLIPAENPEVLLSDEDNRDNNMSLLCRLTLNDKKFLFTGDIEKDRIEELLNSDNDLKADWLKLPHHGFFKENEGELIKRIAPEYGVISTSTDKPPKEKLEECLKANGIRYYNTAYGNVTTVYDGSSIVVKQ